MQYKRLWISLAVVLVGSFAVLGFFGFEIYRQAPPIPQRVMTSAGQELFTGKDILEGQSVWQSMGGQEVGTIWGHGSYVAPDWSADWLHREATWILDRWAEAEGKSYQDLAPEAKAALEERLRQELRTNTYDPQTGNLILSPVRAQAIEATGEHYAALFGDNPALNLERKAYALPPNMLGVGEIARKAKLNAFFFWTAWACVTNRPGQSVSYTQNWPPDELVGNRPAGALVLWSIVSCVFLLGGIGALSWSYAALRRNEAPAPKLSEQDPLLSFRPTPSMKSTRKYFWAVMMMLVAQVALGALTAHYGVEGSAFYGFPLARWFPYVVTRTWHLQLGLFWIATAWLATGLFMGPAISGREPRFQRAGVNLLFLGLLIVLGGSMVGEFLGIRQRLGLTNNFWFGHQGLEYVDLGRFWQSCLFAGLLLWLFLLGRALWPALRKAGENRHLLALFFLSSAAIALFYGAGLAWGRQTNLAVIEYWRWWVVHLLMEGFFEVFATAVIAFFLSRMGLLQPAKATAAVLFSTTIFLGGGIIGTFQHLYFTGTPIAVLALGAVFSALEVVPLVMIGFEAYENLTLNRARPWVSHYKWPLYCFAAVGFWNLVGAGLLGFLINTPIALYYMQGLNTTPVHAHAALFGVYGMLGIGLMLFCLKGLTARRVWKTGPLAFAFWAINLGLVLAIALSVLPVGLRQAWASTQYGMWYARSAEFMKAPPMETLHWLRLIGDSIFAAGVLALGWFVLGLRTGWSLGRKLEPTHPEIYHRAIAQKEERL